MSGTLEDFHSGLTGEHHSELTVGSLISKEVLQQRGYRSVQAHELPPEFADYQRRDGLLIPIRTVRGEIESYQLKPYQPRIGKNGKPIKYETAANAKQIIDVPAAALPYLGDPTFTMLITEGAKKVDSAVSTGLCTTIGLQGVYGWRGKNEQGGTTALPDWELIALNGREVVIAFDSDVMTKKDVRSALDRLAGFLRSRKATVNYLVLPDLPDGSKCGLDDFFANGGKTTDLDKYLFTELPPLTTLASPESDAGIPRLVSRSMREIEEKEIDWLWPGWLPRGMLALLGGYAGDGKSTVTAALAAALSTGAAMPDGTTAPITNTLLVLTEDDVSHVVKKRLAVHGVDEDRVHTLDHVEFHDGSTRLFNLKTDVPLLEQLVKEREIGFIVIDPLSSVMGNSDRNNEGEVRDLLTTLAKMAEETGCTVLGIMHIGKTDGQAKAYQKLMGSTAYTAVARTVWMLSDLPMDHQVEGEPTRKMIGVAKSNYAVAPMPIQYFRPLDGAIEWLGASPLGIDDVFNRLKKSSDEKDRGPNETEKAEEWLLEFMNGKRVAASAVESAAEDEGFGFPTVRKAKKRLGIASLKEMNQWYWLPAVDDSISVA